MKPGEVIRGAREQAGLTQRKVAEGIGVSVTFLSDVERGARPLTPVRAIQIAALLKNQAMLETLECDWCGTPLLAAPISVPGGPSSSEQPGTNGRVSKRGAKTRAIELLADASQHVAGAIVEVSGDWDTGARIQLRKAREALDAAEAYLEAHFRSKNESRTSSEALRKTKG